MQALEFIALAVKRAEDFSGIFPTELPFQLVECVDEFGLDSKGVS